MPGSKKPKTFSKPASKPKATAKKVAGRKSGVRKSPASKVVVKVAAKVVAKSRPAEKIASTAKATNFAPPSGRAETRSAKSKAPTRTFTARTFTAKTFAAKTFTAKIIAGKSVVNDDVLHYIPSDSEPFMCERHRDYFRRKLLTWKEEILRESRDTLTALQTENENHPDIADRASSETDRAIELRARDRQRKLIAKIDSALARLDDGAYGYCEDTGEPISLKRLDARPIATLSIEAQERHERREKVYRDD